MEFPSGIAPGGWTIHTSRAGQIVFTEDQTSDWTRHTFDIGVRGESPVDLQTLRMDLRIPVGDVPVDLEALSATLMGEQADVDRSVFAVGELEGFVRDVMPGTTGVVIRLVPRQLASVHIRALSLDGAPLADAEVRLSSMADWIRAKTGEDGRVVISEVPVREWELELQAPHATWPHAVHGRATVTPGVPELDVPLRSSVVVRARVTRVPLGHVYLSYGNARTATINTVGWVPGPDGTMELAADPDWPEIRVRLERVTEQTAHGWSSETLAQGKVAVTAGALVELEPSE